MAFYMLCAAVAIIWVLGLYSLYIQIMELRKVMPAQREFQRTRSGLSRVQTSQGMLFLSLFMMIFGIILAVFEKSWLERICFLGIAVLFAAFTVKNYIQGRILWNRDAFIWKNYVRKFNSIRGFQKINRQSSEIRFAHDENLVMPANTALQIQALKSRSASSR